MTLMRKSPDDFVIVNLPDAGTSAGASKSYAIVGPGLDPQGILFDTYQQAEVRGRAIARNSKAALWFQPAQGEQDVLVVTFRPTRELSGR